MRIDPTQKKIAVAMILLVALFVGLGWWPAHRRIGQLNVEIQKTQEQILGAAGKADDLADLDKEVKSIRSEIASNQKVIPHHNDLADLMRQLSATIETSHLRDQNISTEQTAAGDGYQTMPIHVAFHGAAPQALAFVRSVETMPRLVQLTALQMVKDHDSDLVTADMKLNTYFYSMQETTR